ncbi:MAG TPA: alpha/beta hydrolase [Myxococcota bacterium]|nr:alpha/beta hydrolase [Myxococcota bacterium]
MEAVIPGGTVAQAYGPDWAPVEHRRVTSFDGTEIAYQVIGPDGAGDRRPVVLLANGLGGTYLAFRHQYAYLTERYRFVSWDYRGLYRSARPADPTALSMRDQARDALAVLDAEGVDRAVIVGWSMGVQVNLEVVRAAPARVAAFVAINGTSGLPFHTVFGGRLPVAITELLLRLSRWQHQRVRRLTNATVGIPWLPRALKALRLVSPTADDSILRDVARDWAMVDMDTYLDTLMALGAHDASDVLDDIRVPALVMAGTDDFFTPVAVARAMADRVTGAELSIVPTGTHYLPAEFPELVNLRLERFLDRIGR